MPGFPPGAKPRAPASIPVIGGRRDTQQIADMLGKTAEAAVPGAVRWERARTARSTGRGDRSGLKHP